MLKKAARGIKPAPIKAKEIKRAQIVLVRIARAGIRRRLTGGGCCGQGTTAPGGGRASRAASGPDAYLDRRISQVGRKRVPMGTGAMGSTAASARGMGSSAMAA